MPWYQFLALLTTPIPGTEDMRQSDEDKEAKYHQAETTSMSFQAYRQQQGVLGVSPN